MKETGYDNPWKNPAIIKKLADKTHERAIKRHEELGEDYFINKKDYYREVQWETKKTLNHYFDVLFHRDCPHCALCDRSFFHLDHIYSIIDGFKNNIPPEIIGSIVNLRFITEHENVVKNKNSDISMDELLDMYEAWRVSYEN